MVRYTNLIDDTICAPVTAQGHAGVAVVRISGPRTLETVRKLVPSFPNSPESHRSFLGNLKNSDGEVIDQSLITYFEKGRSFTGDDVVEVACHGNPLLVNQIVDQLVKHGCRFAERGEFSFRAFYNGKLDLVQAESIHQLVTTNHSAGSTESLHQLQGDLSQSFADIEEELILAISHLEATIDFVEEDIDPQDSKKIVERLLEVKNQVNRLVSSYDVGKNLHKGKKILLIGKTNVGKSSLFNRLFGENRAIVTDIHGTTRDMVTSQSFLGNFNVEFFDTAGIRDTEDIVEKVGVSKSIEALKSADIVLLVDDGSTESDWLSKLEQPKKVLVVINKTDLLSEAEVSGRRDFWQKQQLQIQEIIPVSALKNQGIETLKSRLEQSFIDDNQNQTGQVLTQARHFKHLEKVSLSVSTAIGLITDSESPDIVAQELSLGLQEMQELLGKEYNDEILDKIFSDFCIGK